MTDDETTAEVHGWQKVIDALPPLSAEDREGLKASIAEHGVTYPVLLLPDGRIIDGHHRWELSEGTAETRTLNLSEDEAFIVAMSMNIDRRQMTPETTRERRTRMQETALALRGGGMSLQESAGVLKVAPQTIANWEKVGTHSNIGMSSDPANNSRKIPIDQHDVIVARLDAGERQAAIAADYGVAVRTIYNVAKRRGSSQNYEALDVAPRQKHRRSTFTDDQKQEIEMRYRGGMAVSTLATRYGVEDSTIRRAIKRVRAYRTKHGLAPPDILPEFLERGVPSNVVDIQSRQTGREAIPTPEVSPERIRNDVVAWWRRWGKSACDQFIGLQFRYGDALAPALRAGVEGKFVVEGLTQAAAAYGAAAQAIRCGNTGQEDHGHGSTGS